MGERLEHQGYDVKVSIAVASYNGANFIAEQLDSLYAQTRRPDEVVVADDSSTDDTLRILEGYRARPDCSLTVLRNDTGSPLRPPSNFNRALAACSGDVVLCCDQDDRWDPTKIAASLERLSARPGLACVLNDTRICDADLNPRGVTKMGQVRAAGLPDESFVMGCCAAFRREFLDIALPIPPQITHDGWLVGLSDLLGLTERSEDVLQSYRIHGENVSKGFFINAADDTGRLHMARRRLTAIAWRWSSNDALLRELVWLREAEDRLSARTANILATYPSARLGESLNRLRRQRAVLERRRGVRTARGGGRIASLWTAWHNGTYHGANGLLAALKDALVRLEPTAEFVLWRR